MLRLFSILAIYWTAVVTATTPPQSQCPEFIQFTPNGTCATYPADGLCGPILGGQQVYLGFGLNFQILDTIAVKLINALEANRGIVDKECRVAGDSFVCHAAFPSCRLEPPNDEPVPVLPCNSFCNNFWGKCQAAFDAFFIGAIQSLGQPAETFAFPHCGPQGTFSVAPQEEDIFGNRSVPGLGPFPLGYFNQPRFPKEAGIYRKQDNALIAITCNNPPPPLDNPLDTTGFGIKTECAFPLIEEAGECKIPCPFPVIPVDQQDQIGLAFVVPAVIALIFCIFVFADSCFVIIESQGFNEILRRQKKRFMFRGGSTTDTDEGTGTSGGKSGSRQRRSVLRAATLYSLLGATLGIVYFMIGPLMTLIRRSEISCGEGGQNLDLLQFVLGQADKTDGFCMAQRFAPFILQLVFNLILYAIVRVFMVVTERSRRMTKTQNRTLDAVLLTYCAGIPLLFMIIAATEDELSTNLADFVTQFSRNSAICVMRLSVAEEVILVFMPFIITGCLICGLSYYIYTHLSQINQNVQGIMSGGINKERSSSAVALRLLMIRLSFLGVSTFIVLLVFISATASLMVSMEQFSPRFNNFFLCTATQASTCFSCEAERVLMIDKLPSSVAFAAQIAAMSSITLLFGGFFAAQSAARLYKEYQDGTLKVKVVNLWYGRPANYGKKGGGDGDNSSFQSFQEVGNNIAGAVKESCATLLCLRLRRFRNSIRDLGRARGPVFRFGGRGAQPPPKPRKTTFGLPAWTETKPEEKPIQWQGIVGVPNSSTDPTQWSSSNSNFDQTTRSPNMSMSPYAENPPSWSYSETKLNSVANSAPSFNFHSPRMTSSSNPSFGYQSPSMSISGPPSGSATRREEFVKPPPLPDI